MNSDLGGTVLPQVPTPSRPALQIALALAIVLAVANLSRTIVDRPVDRMEQRFSTGRAPAPTTVAARR